MHTQGLNNNLFISSSEMRKFIRNILLCTLPVIVLVLLEMILPNTTFTFRTWEGISFATAVPHYPMFYPNSKSDKFASGDLCHHTDKAIYRKETWVTDKLGYRNEHFVEKADILFIGDSFIAGSGLAQDETIAGKVSEKLGSNAKVYNMSPGSFTDFNFYVTSGVIKRPRLIVFSIVERELPLPIVFFTRSGLKVKLFKILETGNLNVYLDKGFRFASLKWLKARANNSKGSGVASIDPDVFFYAGSAQKHTDEDVTKAFHTISSYQKYCDSLNIKFVFMPMPDKESVYYELVPFDRQPDYLFKLDSMLTAAGINTIPTLKIYNEYREKNKTQLYYPDDTHWNPVATDLMAGKVVEWYQRNVQNTMSAQFVR